MVSRLGERIKGQQMSKRGKRSNFRVVISEQIKEQLIEDIFFRRYKPGDKLVESALAKNLSVSQTSVREALRSLIAMGFLESEPFKGITVRSFTKQDLWEVYTVRAALESLSIQQLAPKITEEQIADLEQIVEDMVEAGKRGDITERMLLNIEFHKTLIRQSGNKLILRLFENLQFGSYSLMTGSISKMDPVEIAARHRDLIDVLRSRDPDKAAAAIRRHIESVGKPIVESLEAKPPDGDQMDAAEKIGG
ncbi:MAG: GntR family transcriptional regulator [Spirochaetaceae bacterium]|nr:MAG: GntR family transcriptional regulator [Spirochaetaceae bacterium]